MNMISMSTMMANYLHLGSMETILFNFWMPETPIGMALSCLLVMVVAFFRETIRWYRSYRRAQRALDLPMTSADRLLYSPRFTSIHFINAWFHFLEVLLSTLLMLIVMTFNIWLGLAVILGQVISKLILTIFFPNFEA